jgi:hypothetical protein
MGRGSALLLGEVPAKSVWERAYSADLARPAAARPGRSLSSCPGLRLGRSRSRRAVSAACRRAAEERDLGGPARLAQAPGAELGRETVTANTDKRPAGPRERNWDGKRSRQTRMNALQSASRPTSASRYVGHVPTTPPASRKQPRFSRTRTWMLLVRRGSDAEEPEFEAAPARGGTPWRCGCRRKA